MFFFFAHLVPQFKDSNVLKVEFTVSVQLK